MHKSLQLSDRRASVAAARNALTGIAGVLWQSQSGDLGPIFGELDDLAWHPAPSARSAR